MSKLFSPLQLQHQLLKNRLVVSPMCQYSAHDGHANNWHLVHLGQFAAGGVGTIMQEATAVSPTGRISYGDLGLWEDAQMVKLREIVEYVHFQDVKIGIQLGHAGRKASTDKPWLGREQFPVSHPKGWQTLAPSAIGFHPEDQLPQAMTVQQIQQTISDFREATKRAVQIGYDIIELHGAHGYLLHQFLSPLTNLRTDQYGGSFENRVRLVVEIVQAVKRELQEQSLWIRLSATDWAENGWDVEQTIALVNLLQELGVEVVDVSSGGAVREQKIPVEPNYQVPFAEQIKSQTGVFTAAVGLIETAEQAEAIVENQQADLVCFGRAMLRNPHLAYQFAKELDVDLLWTPQYERGKL